MIIDLKTAKVLAHRFLTHTVVVMLVFAGGIAYAWSEYKELVHQKDQLAAERKSFYEEQVLSERNRADVAIALIERKAEIDAIGKIQKAQSSVSHEQRVKDAEEKIQMGMSEFSKMGVNLNASLPCNNTEATMKYNIAKAKYTEIYTLAEAYGLTKRFGMFFFHSGQSMYSACTK